MLQPFTLQHFRKYTSNLVLDTGGYWALEDFQAEVVDPILWAIRNRKVMESWTLLPEGNGKTSLMAGLALYCADFSVMPWIPIAAASRDQAEIMAQQAYQMVRASPGMLRRFRIYEGYRRIQPIRPDHPGPGRRGIKVYAADVGTNDGVIPYPLALCDEMHRWPDLGLYRLWKGKLRKRTACIAGISTAGVPGSEFEQTRDKIRDKAKKRTRTGARLHCEGEGIVMNEWMVDRDRVENMAAVKEANPLSTITVKTLAEDFASPTLDMGDWRRLKCNIPARSTNAAVSELEWDGALVSARIPPGAHIDLGVDVAWKHDTFAIDSYYKARRYGLLGESIVLEPPRDGSTLHPDEVKIAFEHFLDNYYVDAVVIDMGRAEDIAAWLESEHGVTVIDWPQGNATQAADYEAFMKGLREGTLKHTGDPKLRSHVMNAVARPLPGDKRRFDRPSQSRGRRKQDLRVIDALTAAAMVNRFAQSPKLALVGEASDYHIEQL